MSFPLAGSGRKRGKKLLHARAQQLPVWAYKKGKTGMCRAHENP
jgi:hypothetical protein